MWRPPYERLTTPDLWDELHCDDPGRLAEPVESPLEDEAVVDFEQRHHCPFPDLHEEAYA
jgi:hypothetical protein